MHLLIKAWRPAHITLTGSQNTNLVTPKELLYFPDACVQLLVQIAFILAACLVIMAGTSYPEQILIFVYNDILFAFNWIRRTSRVFANFELFLKFCQEKERQQMCVSLDTKKSRKWYLFLPVFDGQLEPVKVHPVTVLVNRPSRIMVEQYLQFSGRSCMVQKCSGKFLTRISQFQVLAFEFVFSKRQTSQFPAEFKGGEYWVFTGQSNQGWTGKCAIGINTGSRMT